jgi:hypothetical protein
MASSPGWLSASYYYDPKTPVGSAAHLSRINWGRSVRHLLVSDGGTHWFRFSR